MFWILALVLIACHSPSRTNPVDPELTPPVELQATVNDTTGSVALSWTRYGGDQPFAEYRVLRNIANSVKTDTLIDISEVDRTSFSDTSIAANTAYEYRIAVVNSSGFKAVSAATRIDGFAIEAVSVLNEGVDAQGTATITWNRYTGARFEAYEIHAAFRKMSFSP